MAPASKSPTKGKVRGGVKPQNEIQKAQTPLVQLLYKHLADHHLSLRSFASIHEIPYTTLAAVARYQRWIVSCDKSKVIIPLARALKVPVVMIYIKAGLLTHFDFILEETLADKLDHAYDSMSCDQTLLAVLPSSKEEFIAWPLEAKTAIILLYQTYSNKSLLDMVQLDPSDPSSMSTDKETGVEPTAPISIDDVVRWTKKNSAKKN